MARPKNTKAHSAQELKADMESALRDLIRIRNERDAALRETAAQFTAAENEALAAFTGPADELIREHKPGSTFELTKGVVIRLRRETEEDPTDSDKRRLVAVVPEIISGAEVLSASAE